VHTRVAVALTGSTTLARFSGELMPRYGGKPVGIAEIVGGRWVYRGQTHTDASGRFQLTAAVREFGQQYFVVYTSVTALNLYGSASRTWCWLCR